MINATHIALTVALVLAGAIAAEARTFRTAHFAITVTTHDDPSQLGASLERAYRVVRGKGLRPPSMISVIVHPSTSAFAARSGTSRVHMAATRARTLHLQPLTVLRRRSDVERTLVHELVHVTLAGGASRLPRWLFEGFAMSVAGQRYPLARTYATPEALDRALASTTTHGASRDAYAAAERLSATLEAAIGRERLVAAIVRVSRGGDLDETFRPLIGMNLSQWAASRIASAQGTPRGAPR